jgi:hypothetical protein
MKKIIHLVEDAFDWITSGFFGDIATRIVTREIIEKGLASKLIR